MKLSQYLTSSIGRKQIVAVTGLALVLFLCGHMVGNFFIFGGPEPFNNYAHHLAGLRPALLVVEFGLGLIFLIHMFLTATLVLENRKARGNNKYEGSQQKGKRSLSTRLMPFTGSALIAFVIWHLLDFTFTNHEGIRSVVDGEHLALYGVVFNSFKDPIHSGLYIIAMFCVGFHVSHGIQSVWQSFGFGASDKVQKISAAVGWLIALGFSSIPVYILMQ